MGLVKPHLCSVAEECDARKAECCSVAGIIKNYIPPVVFLGFGNSFLGIFSVLIAVL
jgi:hypothetical protein